MKISDLSWFLLYLSTVADTQSLSARHLHETQGNQPSRVERFYDGSPVTENSPFVTSENEGCRFRAVATANLGNHQA